MALATTAKSPVVAALEALGIYVRVCGVRADTVEITSMGDAFQSFMPVAHWTQLTVLSALDFAEVQARLIGVLGGNVVVTRASARAFSGGSDLTEFEFELSGRWEIEPSEALREPEPVVAVTRTCSRAME